MLFSFEYMMSLVEIILINVALSGDNAVVIALAAHRLPARQRRRAVYWGGALAIAMQAVLAVMVAQLLRVPGLRFIGGVLLLVIAGKLVNEECQGEAEPDGDAGPRSCHPIVRIALANLAMSFDNVVAVAGVCRSDPIRMAMGLAVSGLILFAFSAAVVELMARYRWIVYAGGAVLAATAAGMIGHDLAGAWHHTAMAEWHPGLLGASAGTEARVLFTVLVVGCLFLPRWCPGIRARGGELARSLGEWAASPFRRTGLHRAEHAAD